MDARIVKLQEIERRYQEINELMLKDEIVSDVKKYTKLSKEQASLKAAYDAYQDLKKYQQILNIAEYRESIASTGRSLAQDSYNRERLLKLDQLKAERDAIKKKSSVLTKISRTTKKPSS